MLLVFLPAAFTPVCSGELDALAKVRDAVEQAGVRVLGVACDSMFALRTWAQGWPDGPVLLSDFWPHGEVSRSYQAFDGDRGLATRVSYLVDSGVVRWATQSAAGVARDMAEHVAAVHAYQGSSRGGA